MAGTAHWAHVGGFLAAMVVALLLGLRARVSREDLLDGRASLEDTSGFFSQAGELERVVEKSAEDADSWYALGQAHESNGRMEKAAQAYENALKLYLEHRQLTQAAAAYAALKEYGNTDKLPPESYFDVACALEETGHAFEAYDLFMRAANAQAGKPVAETALIRGRRTRPQNPRRSREGGRRLPRPPHPISLQHLRRLGAGGAARPESPRKSPRPHARLL